MNLFNKIVVILLILACMILLPVFFVFPDGVVTYLQVQLAALKTGLDAVNPMVKTGLGLALAVLSFLFFLILLVLELFRGQPKAVRVAQTAGGEAVLELKSVAERVRDAVIQLPEVVDVKPKVTAKRRSVNVEIQIETTPDVQVPAKTEEVYETVRRTVEEQMGLKLGKVKINIKHSRRPTVVTP